MQRSILKYIKKKIIIKWRRYQEKIRNNNQASETPLKDSIDLSDKILPFQTVGDSSKYNGKKYKQRNIYAIENTEGVICTNNQIFKAIVELNSSENFKEIVEFLVKKVYQFSKLSVMYRERIASCFKIKVI